MFNENFFENYLKLAPLPLAIERTQECLLLSKQEFVSPILDIGCGDGIFASILFNGKIDVGIDPNPKELERAQKTDKYVRLIQCYGNTIPLPDKSFKTIFSNSVLEHIPDITSVLIEAHRLLDDDGRLYVTLPTHLFDKYTVVNQILTKLRLNTLSKKYSIFFNRFWNHYHFYAAFEWEQLFQETGFSVEKHIEYGKKTLCMLNGFMAPFAFPSFLARKLWNRWFWSPAWRKKYAKTLTRVVPPTFRNDLSQTDKGGLIFFVLRKNDAHTRT